MFGFERRATYFCFVEGQTHCGTEMSLTLGQSIWKVPQSNLRATSKHALKCFRAWRALYAKQPTRDKSHAELEHDFNVDIRMLWVAAMVCVICSLTCLIDDGSAEK